MNNANVPANAPANVHAPPGPLPVPEAGAIMHARAHNEVMLEKMRRFDLNLQTWIGYLFAVYLVIIFFCWAIFLTALVFSLGGYVVAKLNLI